MAFTTRTRDDIRYGYAVGRVRVLEGRLLSRATFERLLDAPDLREQKRVLAETHVGRYLEAADSAEDVERALEAALGDLYEEFLERADLPPAVVRYFRLPHDYANLRATVKARLLGIQPSGSLSSLGSVPVEAFAQPAGLPEPLAFTATLWDEYETPPDLDEVEAEIDRALFEELEEAARESKVRFLRELTTLRIDLANVRVLVRARAKGVSAADLAGRLIPGGTAALLDLANIAPRLGAEDLVEAIVDTRALRHVTAHDLGDIERFDLLADSLLAERMTAARRAANGPEPVLAYVLAREAEVLVLRTLVVGRLSGLDSEAVRQRLRGHV